MDDIVNLLLCHKKREQSLLVKQRFVSALLGNEYLLNVWDTHATRWKGTSVQYSVFW